VLTPYRIEESQTRAAGAIAPRRTGRLLAAWLLLTLWMSVAHALTGTSTTLTLSATTTTVDAAVTLTATVKGGSPSGTVTFKDGSQAIGTATVSSGKAALSAAFKTAGSHSLTAVYGGDSKTGSSTSAAVSLTVNKAATTTTLSLSPTSATVDQTATLTATVSGSSASGTVTFQDGTTVIGTGTVSAGKASLTISLKTAGSHGFAAAYGGDGNYNSSTSATTSMTVGKAATTTTLAVSPNPTITGQATTLSATVSGSNPSGTVTFQDGGAAIGTGTLSGGAASLTASFATGGTHSLTAVFSGDGNYATSTSVAASAAVDVPPSVSMTAPANNTVFANRANITLSAAAADSDGTVTKVEFYNGANLLGTATSAPYTFTWNSVAAGSYSVTAKATDNLGAVTTSGAIAITVNVAPTVSITAPPNNAKYAAGANVNLTATASETNGTIAKVEFFNGANLVGTATNAPYTVTWNSVAAGSYSVTAKVTDAVGGTATSASVAISVIAVPTVSIAPLSASVYAAPANLMLQANVQTGASDVTVTQVAFYNGDAFLGSTTTAPYKFNWSNVAAGSYSITATATDSVGGTGTSGATAVTVVNNAAPTVTLAADKTSATAPATINLTATASDSDGSVDHVEFYQGANLLGTVAQAPYQYQWSNVAAGTYGVTARAVDNLGTGTTSASVQVQVKGAPATVYYIDADQLNTPRMITDASNNVVWRWDNSDPFGYNLPDQNPSGLGTFEFNQRMPGQYYDKETGLHYNYFRDYDPSTGRYVESDPIGLDGGINTYTYGLGNPVSNTDPTGLFVPLIIPGICAAGGCEAAAAAAAAAATWWGSRQPAANSSSSSASQSKACPPNPGNQDPCKGLRDQLAAHEQKYRDYIANPSAGDNMGILTAAYNAGDMSRYTNIINGRIRNLDKQIADFRKQLEECEKAHGK
jgi:chitinase